MTTHIEESIRRRGRELGFDAVGITTAEPFLRDERVAVERVRQGLMEGLPWYTEQRVRRAARPETLLPGARSVVSVAMGYLGEQAGPNGGAPAGRVARYAWGDDYHKVIKARLRMFADDMGRVARRPVRSRIFVDDGPMNDRAAAARAGVGWFGKNTNILTPTHGSWVFLGQVVTDLSVEPDRPLVKTCGRCVRCMEACPTRAIVAPYVLDNSRCVSFLTIEHRGAIPRELRPLIGDRIFGCDACQEACPVNRKAERANEPAFRCRRGLPAPRLIPILALDEAAFRERFRDSAVWRTGRIGLQRNACVALGNTGDRSAVSPLLHTLNGGDALVRAHAAWALGRIGGRRAAEGLQAALAIETEPDAREEIEMALAEPREAEGMVPGGR